MRERLEDAVRLDPKAIESHFELAVHLQNEAAWIDAARHIQVVLEARPDFPNARDELLRSLAMAIGSGQQHELVAVYEDALRILPDQTRLYWDLERIHARLAEWSPAATACSRGLELDPTDVKAWYHGLPLLLAAGDVEGYQRLCRQMLDRFGGTRDPVTAEWTAVTCSLMPDAVSDPIQVTKIADVAVTGTKDYWNYDWFEWAKGIAELRAGRPAEAVEWLEQSRPQANGGPQDAATFAALSIAYRQLHNLDQAETALAGAKAIVSAKRPNPAKGRPFDVWHEWLHADILLREAEGSVVEE